MEQIGKVLPVVLKPYLEKDEARVIEILAPFWPRVAGSAMAGHSRPVAFLRGTLTLECDSTSWTSQLRTMSDEIRAEVNRFLGAPVVIKLLVRYAGPQRELRREIFRGGQAWR